MFHQLRVPCCCVRCCCWVMLFQNQALSVSTIEEYHFSAYFSQEIRVSATLVERCLYSMKSSRPPGDLRWNALLVPKTESAAFLCYPISSVTPSITPPETERGSGNQPLVMSEKFYSRNKGKSKGGQSFGDKKWIKEKMSMEGCWVFRGRMCRPSRKINRPFRVNSMWAANGVI